MRAITIIGTIPDLHDTEEKKLFNFEDYHLLGCDVM
jgi:hypothetical protein